MSVVTEIEPRTVRAHLTLTKGSREEASVFVHPGLKVGLDPAKGRKVVPTRLLKDGETLLIDSPYALVPAMMADDPPYYLCSWNECNRRIQPQTKAVNCPDHCVEEVMWCNEQCRQNDRNRHNLECSWLKRFSSDIRSKHGDSDFGVLWLVARILIHRHIDVQMNRCGRIVGKGNQELAHLHLRGWDSVRSLDGNPKGFRAELVEQWKLLAQSYLAGIALDIEVDTQDALDLFCKLESNSFGLYPGVTGEYPVVSFVSRGGYYGAGIYPTAAMFNHSCCPNVSAPTFLCTPFCY
jgi:trans-aconitate 2-methyltransferase